jgi:hypothetical protein
VIIFGQLIRVVTARTPALAGGIYLSRLLLAEIKYAITANPKTTKTMKISSSITTILSAFGQTDLNIKKGVTKWEERTGPSLKI